MDRNDNGLIIFDKLVMAAIDALLLPAFSRLNNDLLRRLIPKHLAACAF